MKGNTKHEGQHKATREQLYIQELQQRLQAAEGAMQ